MEISPVSLTQVQRGRDGRHYEISADAGNVVAQLKEIDPSLSVTFNEGGNYFVIQQSVDKTGRGTSQESEIVEHKLVRRVPANEWDGRVVREMEARAYDLRHGISAAARLDALDRKRARQLDRDLDEFIGERAYPLMRAIQRDMGSRPKIYVPRGVK